MSELHASDHRSCGTPPTDEAGTSDDAPAHESAGPGHAQHPGHDKHAGHDPEMFRRRFWISLLLTVPLVVTSHMVMDWFGYTLDFPGIEWVGPVLGSVVFLWGGWPFLQGGVAEVRDRQPAMMLLISMAITVAYTASMATSLGWFDLDFWWELAALVTIMLLGHWQEMKAIGQARGALAALAELIPDDAEVVRDNGDTETVAIATLAVGDIVLVRAGGRVPADGEIVDGEAELDESMITGESRPVEKRNGDRVVAGTVSTDSSLRVRVAAVGDDTALAGIQRMVADAQESSSRAQVLADRFAALLFYVATGSAVATFVVWTLLGDVDSAVVKTVTVLVIACPHALGRHPVGDRHLDRGVGPSRDPRQGPTRVGTDALHRRSPVRQDRHPHQGRPRRHRGSRRRLGRRGRDGCHRRCGRERQRTSVGSGHHDRSCPPGRCPGCDGLPGEHGPRRGGRDRWRAVLRWRAGLAPRVGRFGPRRGPGSCGRVGRSRCGGALRVPR